MVGLKFWVVGEAEGREQGIYVCVREGERERNGRSKLSKLPGDEEEGFTVDLLQVCFPGRTSSTAHIPLYHKAA